MTRQTASLQNGMPATTEEVSFYIASMLHGLRELTKYQTDARLKIIDHLLAAAEEEASGLQARSAN